MTEKNVSIPGITLLGEGCDVKIMRAGSGPRFYVTAWEGEKLGCAVFEVDQFRELRDALTEMLGDGK